LKMKVRFVKTRRVSVTLRGPYDHGPNEGKKEGEHIEKSKGMGMFGKDKRKPLHWGRNIGVVSGWKKGRKERLQEPGLELGLRATLSGSLSRKEEIIQSNDLGLRKGKGWGKIQKHSFRNTRSSSSKGRGKRST